MSGISSGSEARLRAGPRVPFNAGRVGEPCVPSPSPVSRSRSVVVPASSVRPTEVRPSYRARFHKYRAGRRGTSKRLGALLARKTWLIAGHDGQRVRVNAEPGSARTLAVAIEYFRGQPNLAKLVDEEHGQSSRPLDTDGEHPLDVGRPAGSADKGGVATAGLFGNGAEDGRRLVERRHDRRRRAD